MRKNLLKTMCAAVTAAALTLSFGAPAVFADDTGILGMLGELEDESLSSADMNAVTSEISISGTVEAGSLGELALNADITCVADPAAGAASFNGSISTSGINYSFGGYFGQDSLIVQIPGLGKALSYNYNADPASTTLGQMIGTEPLTAINNYLKLISAVLRNDPAVLTYGQELTAVFTNFVSGLTFSQADEKECYFMGETKVLGGAKAVITKDNLADFLNGFLQVNLPNGQTMEEYMSSMINLGNSVNGYGESVNITQELQESISDFPDFTASIYMDGETFTGMNIAEVDLEAEGSVLALQFRGNEIPYTDIYLVADGETVGSLNTVVNGNEAVISVNVGEGEGAMCVATANINGETGEYSVSSPYLPSDITGQCSFDGNNVSMTANFMGLSISTRSYEGGTAEKPEGEILELTEMSAEDFQSIAGSLESVFSGLANAA